MAAPSRIDFELVGIATLLKDRRLGVPMYQRSYSWKKDQISDYWADLRSAFAKSDPEYFLGTVVLTNEGLPGRIAVIDGQQRLATSSILLAAIRDEYKARGDDRDAIVQNSYLADRDLDSGEVFPHLTLNSEDDSYFRSLVVQAGDAEKLEQTRRSHKLLGEAYAQLRTCVTVTANDAGSEWARKLSGWVAFLKDSVRVISVTVPNEADAFLIFETLNDRGADLTIADLLKNYLFGRAGTRLDTVRDGWMQVLGSLDLSTEESTFTIFLRHYWSSKYGATRERELYKSIKEHVATEAAAVTLVEELQAASKLYAAIGSSDDEYWSKLGTEARTNVETLLRLDLEQHRPLLLAAMQHFKQDDMKKLLKALVSWSVRGLIVGGIGGGTTEKAYCDAAVEIRSGSVKNTDDVRKQLSEIIPGDNDFAISFAAARVTRAYLARYYLAALENAQSGKSEPELVANEDEEKVNLEHILPKNATLASWPAFTEDEAKLWVHRVGNMTLLAKGPNGRIGNKAWSVKRPVLAASALKLTRSAGVPAEWTIQEITARQQKLAQLALKVWPA